MQQQIQPDGTIALLINIMKVNLMDLTAKVVRLAHIYMAIIDAQETGHFDDGYTPRELDLKRTRVHNQFIVALRECNIDVSQRASTTDLAQRIVRWMPEG